MKCFSGREKEKLAQNFKAIYINASGVYDKKKMRIPGKGRKLKPKKPYRENSGIKGGRSFCCTALWPQLIPSRSPPSPDFVSQTLPASDCVIL